MNDFTKEELKELSFWLTRLAIMENKLDRLNPIHEKINGMIDKYCDHIWADGSGNHLFCGKCGVHGGKR